MIKRLRYIIPALLLLSLTALGEPVFIANACVKYCKETEWVTQARSVKISRCFDFIQVSYAADNDWHLYDWQDGNGNYYNQAVRVKFILQTKILNHVSFKNKLFITLHIPGKSMEEALHTNNQTGWVANNCLSCPSRYDKNSRRCNSLINRKWINQQLKTFVYSRELNDFQ